MKKERFSQLFNESTFGLEREMMRVNKDGRLALTPHPKKLGDRSYNPYFQTDFSESQIEIVTSVTGDVADLDRKLKALHQIAHLSLEEDEYFWPLSMPPLLPDNEEVIPIINSEDQSQIEYRLRLAEKYGKRLQMISGIHFNLGFTETYLREIHAQAESDLDFTDFRNQLYSNLAGQFMLHRWLLTYLFGASPYADDSFYGDRVEPHGTPVRCLRNSSYGYHNLEASSVSYESAEDYSQDIQGLIEDGGLFEEREYYGAARLRGESVADLPEKGVEYIEFRNVDNNPYEVTGMSATQIYFMHAFLIYMLWKEQKPATVENIRKMADVNEEVALENPSEITQYQKEGLEHIEAMQEMADALKLDAPYQEAIQWAKNLLLDPTQTLAYKMVEDMEETNYLSYGMKLAEVQHIEQIRTPYLLKGFEEMETSTQLLMFDALQQGIEVEILDEAEQFLLLKHGDHEELVQKANKTSKDNYVSQLAMANKTVTKKILDRKGFEVPQGSEFHNIETALKYFTRIEKKAFVVKPKSTNYGIGITVFENAAEYEDYKTALEIAFSKDDTVLVEEFIEGTEYRFFVLDGETLAVLERRPAHVTGDGERNIEALIADKNTHPLRGSNHRAPLEKIVVGDIESHTLTRQGYDLKGIPSEGEVVYLRENSNISTGGDSVDVTDDIHPSYKKIAAEIASALDATITGVDLILDDRTEPSLPERPGYSCIEANFNPAMHMHSYVSEGTGRRLTRHVLDLLFPELNILQKE